MASDGTLPESTPSGDAEPSIRQSRSMTRKGKRTDAAPIRKKGTTIALQGKLNIFRVSDTSHFLVCLVLIKYCKA